MWSSSLHALGKVGSSCLKTTVHHEVYKKLSTITDSVEEMGTATR